jgi:hypothetical protein
VNLAEKPTGNTFGNSEVDKTNETARRSTGLSNRYLKQLEPTKSANSQSEPEFTSAPSTGQQSED